MYLTGDKQKRGENTDLFAAGDMEIAEVILFRFASILSFETLCPLLGQELRAIAVVNVIIYLLYIQIHTYMYTHTLTHTHSLTHTQTHTPGARLEASPKTILRRLRGHHCL